MGMRWSALPILCAVLFASGCAQPPTEQITAAEQAVNAAQQSGAATYLADEYAKLEGTLAAIKKEVAEQETRFALFRDYSKAEQLAASAKTDADRVREQAAKKREEARTAAIDAHRAASEAVKATLDLVARAPAGKDRAALESIKTDAEALRASVNDVQMMIDKSDFLGAQTKAKAIQEKSQAVSHEVEAALAKIGKGKPSGAAKKK